MTSEQWARTSMSIFDSTGEVAKTIEFAGSTLEQQLDEAEAWLREHGAKFDGAEGASPRVRLFSSWTPSGEQHAMALPQNLIAALARVNGVFWMDVYPEDD